MRLCALTLLMLCTPSTALIAAPAAAGADWARPYEAVYEASYGPLGMAKVTYRLENTGGEEWLFQSSAEAVGWLSWLYSDQLSERSRFRLLGGDIVPLAYSARRQGGETEEQETVRFNPSASTALADDRGNPPVELDLPPGTVDRMLLQLVLRREIAEGRSQVGISFVDGDDVERYAFAVTGEESVSVPAGRYRAVRVERTDESKKSTVFWLAPALSHLPVRLDQVKSGRPTLRLLLKDYRPLQ